MTIQTLLQSELWREFETNEARRNVDPVVTLKSLIECHLQAADMLELADEIGGDMRRNGVTEKEADAVIRRYRAEKRRQRDAA